MLAVQELTNRALKCRKNEIQRETVWQLLSCED